MSFLHTFAQKKKTKCLPILICSIAMILAALTASWHTAGAVGQCTCCGPYAQPCRWVLSPANFAANEWNPTDDWQYNACSCCTNGTCSWMGRIKVNYGSPQYVHAWAYDSCDNKSAQTNPHMQKNCSVPNPEGNNCVESHVLFTATDLCSACCEHWQITVQPKMQCCVCKISNSSKGYVVGIMRAIVSPNGPGFHGTVAEAYGGIYQGYSTAPSVSFNSPGGGAVVSPSPSMFDTSTKLFGPSNPVTQSIKGSLGGTTEITVFLVGGAEGYVFADGSVSSPAEVQANITLRGYYNLSISSTCKLDSGAACGCNSSQSWGPGYFGSWSSGTPSSCPRTGCVP